MILALFGSEAAPVTVASFVLAFGATVAAVGGWVVQRRNAETTASTSYVDANLKAMDAVLQTYIADNQRVRALAEGRAIRIDALEAELQEIEAELARVQRECEDCLARVRRLETKGKP